MFLNYERKRPQSSKVLDIDRQICDHISKYPLLAGTSVKLASTLPTALRRRVMAGYERGVEE